MAHWRPDIEECGLVLLDGTVIPMTNGHDTPEKAFGLLNEEVEPIIRKHGIDFILGIFHTHPSNTDRPSELDVQGWPDSPGLRYFIVTESSVAEWAKDSSGEIRRVALPSASR